VHRPGAELRRITPRTAGLLESGRVPWVARAQREHDEFTDVLRDRGVEVHYMADLLADVLGGRRAREEAVGAALTASELGAELEPAVRRHLDSLTPEELASALIAGLTAHELPDGRGLRYDLLEPRDFVLEPAVNLAHSRDCGIVIGEHVLLPGSRRREAGISGPVYRHLPMFAGLIVPEPQHTARLDCADILLMAPGVVALGVGERTSPAAAESLARRLLGSGAARAVLAVPLGARARRLDTTCTIVGPGTVLMAPAQAFTLTALTMTVRAGSLSVSRRWPFLEAAAAAIGLDRLMLIETAADPPADG
jgi:arginine deiminase